MPIQPTQNPMFAKFDTALGKATPTVAGAPPSNRADEIRALADSATQDATDTSVDPTKVFGTPLTRIAAGNGSDNVDVAKGALKKLLGDFSSAGAQNAGPIGKDMQAHAPKLQAAFDALNTFTKPKGLLQKEGSASTDTAEAVLPVPSFAGTAKKAASAVKAAVTPTPLIEKITQAMTPVLTPTKIGKGISESAKSGQVFDAAAMPVVKRSVQAVQDVASVLGKKATDIIRPGIKKAGDNVARLGQAIGDYSKTVVTPFLQKAGVNYNFADLKKSLELVRPSESLDSEASSAYNKIKDRVLQTIADKVGPDVKNISSLAGMRKATADTAGTVAAKTSKGDVDFWDARKIIDHVVEEETKGKAWGDASVVGAKAAYKDLRNGFAQYLSDGFRYPGQMENVNKANEFLKSSPVAKMDKTDWNLTQLEHQFGLSRNPASDANAAEWEKHMANMSSLYDGMTNVGSRATKEYGKKWLTLMTKEHPIATRAIKYGLGAIGAGALFKAGQEAL